MDEDAELKWTDPEPYTEEERKNHPHDRGAWIPFGPDWIIAAASARGIDHRNRRYRDDDFAVRILQEERKGGFPPWKKESPVPYAAVIAVADGLGSRPLSRHGARAAARGVTGVDERLAHEVYQRIQQFGGSPDFSVQLQSIIGESASRLLEAAFDSAAAEVNKQVTHEHITVEELHSTLIVVFAFINPHVKHQLALVTSQVGDGSVYVYAPDDAPRPSATVATAGTTPDAPDASEPATSDRQDGWTWIQMPQVEATGSQVTPFMTRYQANRSRLIDDQRLLATRLTCLLAMTDGPGDLISPYDPEGTGDPFIHVRPFFADVTTALETSSAASDNETRGKIYVQKLKEILQGKLEAGDDITLLCLLRNDLIRQSLPPQ